MTINCDRIMNDEDHNNFDCSSYKIGMYNYSYVIKHHFVIQVKRFNAIRYSDGTGKQST